MIKKPFVITLIAILGYSCSSPKGEVIAEAYSSKLYVDEISDLVGSEVSYEDSVLITQEYIQLWLRKQVLLHKAAEILTEKEKNKTAQLEQYKADLLTYEVLNKLAIQSIDTGFGDAELQAYYDNNKEDFELSQNIIKINFFKILQSSEDLEMLWSNFKAGDESIYGKLKSLSENGGNYYTDKTRWVFFDDILKEIPINTYNQEHYLNNNKYIRLNDDSFVYFIKIINFKIRSSISPFSMEKKNIRELLLMKRQQEMVKSIETKLIDEAYSKKEIRTF